MPIITISRGSASGGLLLARGLATALGYDLVSREEILQEATAFGASEQHLQQAILKPFGFWDRLHHERRRYLAFVQAALCERVQGAQAIYHGNAGHLLLAGVAHVLCVRLVAPMTYRVRRVMEDQGMSQEAAIRYIEQMDRQREAWTRFLYGVSWLDPSLYDLTINLQTLAIEGAVNIVAAAAQRPEFQPTEASRRAMANLLLASRVRAALAADERTAAADVDVRAEEGVVRLRGKVRPAATVGAVIEVAEAVPQVQRVEHQDLVALVYTV